jgi:hypothetical protein
MPLINCPECNTEVSDTAAKCPKCAVQLRKAKRSFFGQLFKWTFIVFNLLMIWWLVAGLGDATEGMDAMSDAEQAGAAIGTGIGAFMVMVIWAVGDIILGLFVMFTRPSE